MDEVITVSDGSAYEGVRLTAKKEGILVGISLGANVYGALELSKRFFNKKIVTVAPDGLDKYMFLNIFN